MTQIFPTQKEVLKNLNRCIERELKCVRFRPIYLDTVQVLSRRPLASHELTTLSIINSPGRVFQHRSKNPNFYVIRMQRPTRGSTNYLSHLVPQHQVNRLDFALDLVVDSSSEAQRLHDFLVGCLRQPWHGKRVTNLHEGTLYYDRAWNRRNVVLYADRPSKITDSPCAHIEFRFYGTSACATRGIYCLADILAVDLIGVLQRNLKLSALRESVLLKRIDNAAGKATLVHNRHCKIPSSRDQKAALLRRLMARRLDTSWAEITHVPVQKWFEIWKPFRKPGIVVDAAPDALINKHQCPFIF